MFGHFRMPILAIGIICWATERAPLVRGVESIEIPRLGRPGEHFFDGAGTNISITATANPVRIRPGEWLTYSLEIRNLLNAPDAAKPSLKTLAAFEGFQIEEEAALDPPADPDVLDRRVFVYRLRPLTENSNQIPALIYKYFDPRRITSPNRPQDRFATTSTKLIALEFLPLEKPPPRQPIALDLPTHAETFITGESVLLPPEDHSMPAVWWLALALPPLLAVGWLIAWRRLYPDAMRMVQLRRNKAVRAALAGISAARGLSSEQAAARIVDSLGHYLRDRWGAPAHAVLWDDFEPYLKSTACSAAMITMGRELFEVCDLLRFAPGVQPANDLAEHAERFVIAMEEAA